MTVGHNAARALIFGYLLMSLGALAQKTKSQLKSERLENLKKIKETERILKETGKQKENSLGELNALTQRVRQQESLTQSIQSEINLLDVEINQNTHIIEGLREDLRLLKEEYTAMLFSAQKASGKVGQLMLLFSSRSFTQLFMRLKYMEQYGSARKNQANAIQRISGILAGQVEDAQRIRAQKNILLHSRTQEGERLDALRERQDDLVRNLEKDEQKLKQDIKATEKAVARIDQLISAIVREETTRAARKSASSAAENTALSSTFERNKAKFPWPAPGFISQQFGRHQHPVLKGIVVSNDGINIQTRQNELVRTIFKGEVRAVAFIPSIGNSVIIGHGNYYTVYSGLKDVQVKQKQTLEANQAIGRVLTNADGISELRFQIRKNTSPVNPEEWLRP